jgi:benzoyl-CoA 2,3-dioxygenase component A
MPLRLKQHLIDPETCIRCNSCELVCPTDAISHDTHNYVVDPARCNFCMDCVSPCPTGAIDNWFLVNAPYATNEQFVWDELPPHAQGADDIPADALDAEASALLLDAHARAGGMMHPPATAAKPRINLFGRDHPATARVTGNMRITAPGAAGETRHIILDFAAVPFPVLEGQTIGIIPPGLDAAARPHAIRLYSVASPRDGERQNTNNLALTVKRIELPQANGETLRGAASNYLCDQPIGGMVQVTGPYGASFLMPDDPETDILMICTGTGAAPFRGFIGRRLRTTQNGSGRLHLFFGARSPRELPYFGPLQKIPPRILHHELVYSRVPGHPHEYVQDRLRKRATTIAKLLRRDTTHLYICGRRGLEDGVNQALTDICRQHNQDWTELRGYMLEQGRFHAETY